MAEVKTSGEDVDDEFASITQEVFMTHRNAPLTPDGLLGHCPRLDVSHGG